MDPADLAGDSRDQGLEIVAVCQVGPENVSGAEIAEIDPARGKVELEEVRAGCLHQVLYIGAV